MQYEILLPIYNQIGYTEYCIRKVFRNEGDYKLVVIDNGSNEETKQKLLSLREEFPFVLRTLPVNVSWAIAINIGLRAVHPKTDRVILLHNDCFMPPNLIAYVDSLEESFDPQVGLLIPRTCYSREPALLTDKSIAEAFSRLKHGNKDPAWNVEQLDVLLNQLYGDFDTFASSRKNAKRLTFCHIPDTYCAIVAMEVFKKTGLFNESFETTGWVERYWAQKMFELGYEAWILNEIYVHHHGNLTTDGEGLNYGECYTRDQVLYERLINGDNKEPSN